MADNFEVLEPVIDPNNRISFLLDWELTMKCNLDCSYCGTGIYDGHDNSTKHPPLDECLKTIDFMLEYVDLYMSHKPKGIRYVILNVYGGESLHHPDIVKILQTVKDKYQRYQDRWHLTVTTTTNAIVSEKKLNKILPLIDEFTCSYHSESTDTQKLQFKKNLLSIKNYGTRLKCIILMHAAPDLFSDSEKMISWCIENNIKHLPRQLDHCIKKSEFNYDSNQVIWLQKMYKQKSRNTDYTVTPTQYDDKFDLSDSGRACCGGRSLCHSHTDKKRSFFVENKFPDWYCSVNEFFLYVKQINGEIFVNKDCKMSFDGKVAPIGTLSESDKLLDWTRDRMSKKDMPVIQCKKYRCLCGLCAPKAKHLDVFKQIMKKYQK